ncbi:hypothetical protein GOZ80_18190 [Agrobacterium vitis]|uniref:Acyl-CoA dehydrogenase family protein n=1 Tax=Agrobacterium vitis TaxID=373 RepID=A0AAE4X250_AGRVI|nr:acyl-CoA dehydrogenase family protein [Agrobacterium vitis]MBF2714131.1 acyl-CoA dehydrogenase family protein [Agrobacterium vitis]MUO81510.1 hypothetical protein [Agrobacterium vitis]MUO95843.1 hypothetical protein [Agrobacterium vitis]MVA93922.1 hypothetical protein [Agrobacterium vitis]MVB03571.1 hypothetical protein [Agrobacterium vitis]
MTIQTFPEKEASNQLILRACGLKDQIRAQAGAAERLGRYTPELHQTFLKSGFYNLLTPTRYGGLETDLRTFAKIMIEIGRGDPGTAWCLCLGQGHALTTATHWPEQGQREAFHNGSGYFRASHGVNPSGTAQRVEGGWLVNARSPYQSGVAYATHATVTVRAVDEQALKAPASDAPARVADFSAMLHVLIPAGKFKVSDDWGADRVFGMRASGSNSVIVEDLVVADHQVARFGPDPAPVGSVPGARLHDNPIYAGGPSVSFAQLELVVTVVGAARAALDEYEALAKTKAPLTPGTSGLRFQDPFYQRDFGAAKMKADAAEAIVLHTAEAMSALSRDAVTGSRQFDVKADNTFAGMILEAGELACDAVDILFRSAGTSASMANQPMQRYLRDIAIYRTHRGSQYNSTAQRYGAVALGAFRNPT